MVALKIKLQSHISFLCLTKLHIKEQLQKINDTSICGKNMKSDLGYIPCTCLYGGCHKYLLEILT